MCCRVTSCTLTATRIDPACSTAAVKQRRWGEGPDMDWTIRVLGQTLISALGPGRRALTRKRSQADETGGTEGSLRRRAGADSEEARMGAAGGHRGLPHGGQGHSRAMRPPMPADHSPPTPADQSPPMLAGHSPAAVEARGGQTNQARPCFCGLKGLFSK